MATPKYKLHYFDGRGRAEIIRMIFAEKKIPYEDIRVKPDDWPKLKATTPTGVLPFLEVDDDKMCQSMAIARYLANEYDLYGGKDNNKAKQKVDEILDDIADIMTAFYTAVFEKDKEKQETLFKEVAENKLTPFLARMETKLTANKDGFLVGSSVTFADFSLYNMLLDVGGKIPNILEKSPKCKEHRDKVGNLPNIKAWIDKRPKTDY